MRHLTFQRGGALLSRRFTANQTPTDTLTIIKHVTFRFGPWSRPPSLCQAAIGSTPAAQCKPYQRLREDAYVGPLDPEILITVSQSGDEDVAPPPLVDKQYLSNTMFADLKIAPDSKRALAEVLRYDRCSLVQAAAIPKCLGPEDVIAKAKTGTGKTLAFIIPTIEKVLAHRAPQGKVSALVLSPTRELARQIQAETTKMLTFHRHLSSMVVYGGVDTRRNIKALAACMPDILIATPGRCWDLMKQAENRSLNSMLSHVGVLVLDEADNLLDMGFRPQILRILGGMPPTRSRQTFLFSATFPADVRDLAGVALKLQHEYVDAVGKDVATPTQVDASSLVVPIQQLRGQLMALLAQHMAQDPEYKIIVFLPTAFLTAYFAKLFSFAGLHDVMVIHSRMSQGQRDKVSAEFRSGSRKVLFSSDVSARGVDYPNVTLVLQFGAPSNREQYIHRAGRTGRAGQTGQCVLLVGDHEAAFLGHLTDLDIKPLSPLPLPFEDKDIGYSDAVPNGREGYDKERLRQGPAVQQGQGQRGRQQAGRGSGEVGREVSGPAMSAELAREPSQVLQRAAELMGQELQLRAFVSLLGYYKGHELFRKLLPPAKLVAIANEYAVAVMGCPEPPALTRAWVRKLGFKMEVSGLVLAEPAATAAGTNARSQSRSKADGGRQRQGGMSWQYMSEGGKEGQAAASPQEMKATRDGKNVGAVGDIGEVNGVRRRERWLPPPHGPHADPTGHGGAGGSESFRTNTKRR
ncbi:hypothetical protein VaNZ11_011861 [Volvox africanus]|uniref:ATP-dependent RNA helicase n=1 Tax=Volvox africanus TaxID=51714 RepID=A0ABQ5SCH7_9CHLO|nr:hypothetical protein VaNZ11_011861 [Volvox africanus]